MDVVEAEVPSNGAITIKDVKLKRVIGTPGWVSSDFHLHSIFSPDSGILMERRTLTAAGEGMDVLQSSDHDWVVDYAPMIDKLVSGGFIPAGSLVGLAGQEVSPNHMGHINAFPLHADTNKIDGGALDWSYSPHDTIDPSADYAMSPRDIMAAYRSGVGGTQDKILMVNHLADQPTSLLIVSSWVTSPFYEGVPLLSTYIEPSSQRLLPDEATTGMPVPFEDNGLVVADMDAVELTMSGELYTNKLRETGLPQWFNLLNMGILVTGTGDSDSHRETVDQLGLPRNFIASSVDPKDGIGTFTSFDQDAYVKAIRGHKVVVSAGPFVTVKAKGEDGKTVGVGDLVKGKNVKFFVDVKSPSWAWFDTVEVYANTEPQPADDDGVSVFKGVASDPKSFFMPYHVPKFYYEPNEIFTTSDGSLANWKEEDGVISATLEFTMDVDEDTWVVVFVSGNQGTEGFRSMFPLVTKSIADPTKMGKPPADWTLDGLIKDSHMASSAWAFANPIFIDVDGDANGDGNPFEAKYVKSGISPVKREW
jgi:hypothetical protein